MGCQLLESTLLLLQVLFTKIIHHIYANLILL